MSRRTEGILGALVASLSLAACNEAPEPTAPFSATDLSALELRQLFAENGMLTDGLYRVQGEVDSASVPELPEDDVHTRHVIEAMRMRLANPPELETEVCFAADTAFDPRGQAVVTCSVPEVSGGGDTVSFTLVCPTGDPDETSTAELQGTMGAEGYDLTLSGSVPTTPGPTAKTREATIVTKLKAERIGECAG